MKKSKDEKFDILFLCHEKDKGALMGHIAHARENILGYRKIFVLSKEDYFPYEKDITFVDEKLFPFDKKTIGEYAPNGRAGWYFQQFLKLYFFRIMGEKVLNNLLIVDADLTFIKKTTFFKGDKPLYNFEVGYHEPYYEILERVFGFGKQISSLSGTVHHMMFQRKYVDELLDFKFKSGEKVFWKEIMDNIDMSTESGFSEEDLYLNYMLKYYPDKIKIRKIRFIDFPYGGPFWRSLFRILGYSYIASHDYFDKQRFPALRSFGIEILKMLGLKRKVKDLILKFGLAKRK